MRYMFLIMLALFVGAEFYVGLRLWQMAPWSVLRWTALTLMVLCTAAFFLVFMGGESLFPASWMPALYRIGTSWLFIFLYLLIFTLLFDLLRLLLHKDILHNNIWLFGIIAAFTAIVMVAGYVAYRNKERIELTIPLAKDNHNADGVRKIVAISDLHLGYGIGGGELREWIKLINAENPDLVLIAGDIIDSDIRPVEREGMMKLFSEIKSKYGVFAVPGNHEYISGIDRSIKLLGRHLTVLRDSVVSVGGVTIAGRDDRANPHRKPLGELLAGVDRSQPLILLDHQPYDLDNAAQNGVDIQISGHTHHGQVWPISWITERMYEVADGYVVKDGAHIIVTSGIGIWGGKFRIGTRSEYIVIKI